MELLATAYFSIGELHMLGIKPCGRKWICVSLSFRRHRFSIFSITEGTSVPTVWPSPTQSITIMQRGRELEPVPVITGLDDRWASRVNQDHSISSATTIKTNFLCLSVGSESCSDGAWKHNPLHMRGSRESSDGYFSGVVYLNSHSKRSSTSLGNSQGMHIMDHN